MNTFFSPLRASSATNFYSPNTVLSQYQTEAQKTCGKHAEVFIVSNKRKHMASHSLSQSNRSTAPTTTTTTSPKRQKKMYAMKRQILHNAEFHLRARRERIIFESLTSLYRSSKCFNFIYMHDWFEAKDDPYEPRFAREDDGEEEEEEEEEAKYPFMHFVLECADRTLESCLALLSIRTYKEIVFQVLYALDVAGKEFQFCHYDLHPKNVLLLQLPVDKKCCMFIHSSTRFYTSGEIVKITDFGLSRLRTKEGKVLYNERDPLKELYLPNIDLQSMAAWKSPRATSTVDKQSLSAFKRKLRTANTPGELLSHPFFEELQEKPNECKDEDLIVVSIEGVKGIPTHLHKVSVFVSEENKFESPFAARSTTPRRTASRAQRLQPDKENLDPSSPYTAVKQKRNTSLEATEDAPFVTPKPRRPLRRRKEPIKAISGPVVDIPTKSVPKKSNEVRPSHTRKALTLRRRKRQDS